MELIIYFGFYLLVSALFIIYSILDAPVCDENGNKIENSKLEKMKRYNNLDIFKGRTKEWDSEKGKFRQYRSTQGKNPKQIEDSGKIIVYAYIGILIILIGYGVINSIYGLFQ